MPNRLKFKKEEKKICTGHRDYVTKEHVPCDTQADMTNSKFDKCFTCNELDGFKSCLLCKGLDCKATREDVISYCNEPHVVYLTNFGQGKFKVGTTSYKRRYERLLEQGATESIIIATGTGKQVRHIEDLIGKLGFYTLIQPTYKIRNLIYNDEKIGEEVLVEKYKGIKRELAEKFPNNFVEPQYIYFDTLEKLKKVVPQNKPQLSLFGNASEKGSYSYKVEDKIAFIKGEYLWAIGSIIVYKEASQVKAFNLKKWQGYLVEI